MSEKVISDYNGYDYKKEFWENVDHDLDRFTTNLRQTITAAKSYHHYQNPSAKTVKFIIKTPSL